MATEKTTTKRTPRTRTKTASEATLVGSKVLTAGDIGLQPEHKAEIHSEGYSQCVRALMQNWRQGTVACKDRSEVAFSNKKPWKQKGTGRARAGSARSPLWRKGGVIFGPQERTRTHAISKNLRRKVCNGLLWQYLDADNIVALSWTPQDGAPKTAHAFNALKDAGLSRKDIIFFVDPADRFTHAAFANLPNVRMLLFDQWNAYDISNGDMWMILEKDLDAFKEMVSTWI
jgi:large subunit ribosomal protein L4